MATIQITLDDQDKEMADKLFKDLGMTTSGAIKIFINQAILDQALPFIPSLHRTQVNKNSINLKIDSNGNFVLPKDAGSDVKNWAENG